MPTGSRVVQTTRGAELPHKRKPAQGKLLSNDDGSEDKLHIHNSGSNEGSQGTDQSRNTGTDDGGRRHSSERELSRSPSREVRATDSKERREDTVRNSRTAPDHMIKKKTLKKTRGDGPISARDKDGFFLQPSFQQDSSFR